jgi:RNA-binding protein 39
VKEGDTTFSKDQRTVFVTQLVMRATEKDIRRYFRRKVGCKVKEVILLKDKRTNNHKGCAYVQLGRIEDVNKAVGVAGQAPDFQRFPILIKASEAEKNYVIPASSSVVTASMMGTSASLSPMFSREGQLIEAQKVYIGGLDPSVSEEHLFALFSQFGQLEKVSMQMDPTTQASRGYAFLTFRDPKDANLAIQTMSNQVLAGRPLKTGWANQSSSVPGVDIVISDEFPADANGRTQKAFAVLAQLMGSVSEASADSASVTAEKAIDVAMGSAQDATSSQASSTKTSSSTTTVAKAKAIMAVAEVAAVSSITTAVVAQATAALLAAPKAAATEKAMEVGGVSQPTQYLLVHNMFDKDEETEEGWAKEIKEDFIEEASRFGTVNSVNVMSEQAGGKLYASFATAEAAESCAKNLAGRWFDKRQLRVEYIQESDLPKDEK